MRKTLETKVYFAMIVIVVQSFEYFVFENQWIDIQLIVFLVYFAMADFVLEHLNFEKLNNEIKFTEESISRRTNLVKKLYFVLL